MNFAFNLEIELRFRLQNSHFQILASIFMITDSFKAFFVQPISRFFKAIQHDFQFLSSSLIGIITLKTFIDDQKSHVLERSVHTFELLIKIIIIGFAVNELREKINSNILHDLMTEGFVIVIFYVLFLGLFYSSNLFEKLLKNNTLTELGTRVWNVYVLIFIILLQFTDVIDEKQTDVIKNQNLGGLVKAFFIGTSVHFVYVFVRLKRAQILSKRSLVYLLFLMLYTALSLLFFTAIELGLTSSHT